MSWHATTSLVQPTLAQYAVKSRTYYLLVLIYIKGADYVIAILLHA